MNDIIKFINLLEPLSVKADTLKAKVESLYGFSFSIPVDEISFGDFHHVSPALNYTAGYCQAVAELLTIIDKFTNNKGEHE